jgi:glycosyltransferase involved in cell wall biosynthesis
VSGGPAVRPTEAPLVSCVVPVYNGGRFIGDALRSIQAQSYPRLEIIVVDDGSTDDTPDAIAAFGGAVHSLRQANQGPAAARNAGIGVASGSFVGFLDADDLWHPEKVTRQLARFGERPELQVAFAGMRNVAHRDAEGREGMFNPDRWPAIPFSPCTLLARREAFEQIGLFNPELRRGEDTEWFVRMMMRGVPYEVMPDILLERRIHSTNLCRDNPPTPGDVVGVLKLVLDRRRREGW